MDDLPATRTQGDDAGPDWRYLSVLLIAAAVLRLYRLGADSLWYDEILSERRATVPLGDAYDLLREGTHPPGYSQAILRPWLTLGDGEWMLRFPSAVLGVATVAMTAMLGTRLAGRRAGLAAAALLTVMPLHLYYSREGRMYALFALVLLAWVMALIRARERNTLGSWTMYTVLGAAALYTHYYAGFTVLAVVGATAVLELRHEITTRTCRWLIATIGIGVLFAPWLPTFRYQLGNDPVWHLSSPGFSDWVRLPVEFFAGFVEYSMIDPSMNQYVESLFKATVTLIPLAVLLLFGNRHLRTVADRTPAAAFAAAVVGAAFFGTLLLAFVASQFRPLFDVRYFVGILPFLAILIGAALARTRPMTVIAFGALFASAALHTALTIDETWRPAYRDATDQIEQDQPDDVIVVFVDLPSVHGVPGIRYYLDEAYHTVEYDGSVRNGEFAAFLDDLEITAPRTWVLQAGTAPAAFDAPPGFVTSVQEQHDSRFFHRHFTIKVTALDREDR